jgi:chromosome segregation ATPase
MGLLKAIMGTGGTVEATKVKADPPLEAARRAVVEAEAAVEAEAKGIAAVEETVRSLTEQIAGSDPDVGAPLGRLVTQRDTARGKLEALQARAAAAQQALAAARAALRREELAALRRELVSLIAEMPRLDALLEPRILAFEAELYAHLKPAVEAAVRINNLVDQLRAAGESVEETGASVWIYWFTKGATPLDIAGVVARDFHNREAARS